MNLTITESDKKLLSFLTAFLLAVLFIFLVFRPLYQNIQEIRTEVAIAKEEEISMDTKASLAEDMEGKEQAAREKLQETSQRFYPILESQEAENMVTVLLLNHNLQVQDLTIVMPKSQSGLKWYQYAREAQALQEGTQEGTQEETSKEGFGVYTARIGATAEGRDADIKAFLDEVSVSYPAISILSAEMSQTEDTGSLTISLEIYMCGQ